MMMEKVKVRLHLAMVCISFVSSDRSGSARRRTALKGMLHRGGVGIGGAKVVRAVGCCRARGGILLSPFLRDGLLLNGQNTPVVLANLQGRSPTELCDRYAVCAGRSGRGRVVACVRGSSGPLSLRSVDLAEVLAVERWFDGVFWASPSWSSRFC